LSDSNNVKHKVVALVGMAGSGKSEVAAVFQQQGYKKVRFGDITDEELHNRSLEMNEDNERLVRELFRAEHGMGAYAVLNIPRINILLHEANVVVDGLYSWEEYLKMKKEYGERFKLLAVWSSPETRYKRLAARKIRGLTREEAESRDRSEIENSDKGGPIAVADYTIVNETTLEDLQKQTAKFLEAIK
jgi:dephospho-CoA kinase